MPDNSATIAAIATASGRGGVGIIRVSGPKTVAICDALLGAVPEPRKAVFKHFKSRDGALLDSGLALFFQSPASYTGEDTLELQGHGGPVVLDMLLRRVLELGAQLARPGEFTERAFLNDKMDLAQAEAVADVIDAGTEQAVRSAQRSLQGEFSQRIEGLQQQLTQLRLYVESAIDFSDEDIDFLASDTLKSKTITLLQYFEDVQKVAKQGCLLRDGMTVVIVGKPNAGKSSLLNKLAKNETAIVTPVAGTTRDVLREKIQIDGMPLHIVDTAGLRETNDIVEKEGVKRAQAEIKRADRVLLVIDDQEREENNTGALLKHLPPHIPVSIIHNKIDLTGREASVEKDKEITSLGLSTKSGEGLDNLAIHLKESMGFHAGDEGVFMARRRHLDALEQAHELTTIGINNFAENQAAELFAEDLRQAQQALSSITGKMTPDDLLGEIFSSFCIGK
jgi:tRNA modification GTPase